MYIRFVTFHPGHWHICSADSARKRDLTASALLWWDTQAFTWYLARLLTDTSSNSNIQVLLALCWFNNSDLRRSLFTNYLALYTCAIFPNLNLPKYLKDRIWSRNRNHTLESRCKRAPAALIHNSGFPCTWLGLINENEAWAAQVKWIFDVNVHFWIKEK